jgi:hypothetical protein
MTKKQCNHFFKILILIGVSQIFSACRKWAEHQNFMVRKRGFPSFKIFSDELLRLYKNRAKGQTVNDLFAPMVEWVKQNADN